MAIKVECTDVLVKVEIHSPHKTVTVAVGEEFFDEVVIEIESWIRPDGKEEIQVFYEDDIHIFIGCPQDAFIYRTYQTIAIDD